MMRHEPSTVLAARSLRPRRIVRESLPGVMGFSLGALAVLVAAMGGPVSADTITLKNGMQLQGEVAKVTSILENPTTINSDPAALTPVVFVDDSLRRTFFPSRQIRVDGFVANNPAMEKIRLQKRTANSTKRIGVVGPVVKITPFDEFGNRTYTMQTGQGLLSVIQGITEVTPVYTKLEGLQVEHALIWDMRIATNSLPRETLSRILRKQLDPRNPDERLRVMRLFTQAQRFEDARQELSEILRDFPELAEFKKQERELIQLSAAKLLQEAELRANAGQHRLAYEMLANFPADGVAGETLIKVREVLGEYEEAFKQGTDAVKTLEELARGVKAADNRERIEKLVAELKADLNFNTLPRLADYLRLSTDEKFSSDQKLALAISGWLLGSGNATDNLTVALSTTQIRDLVRKYLRSKNPGEREQILSELQSVEGATAANVARVLANMKPALDPTLMEGEGVAPGLCEQVLPGTPEQADITYYVQLPPEYDPYRRYPCVVTLSSTGLTPREQMQWWTGRYDPQLKLHLGQASRHGYIVVAPAWTKPHQKQYEYSAREHAIVLSSLRDAVRRFAIDTDRVFISGHSGGGDAAWDIAFAHPDLFAGVVPIVATADKYVGRYWENGRMVPMYFVTGELDGDKLSKNGLHFDRYLSRVGFDVMITDYQGRGHEHFQEDLPRIMDWMNLHRRDFFPKEFKAVSMRPWDNFFWYGEMREFPRKAMVLPTNWPPQRNSGPVQVSGKIQENNGVHLDPGGAKATLYLAPEMVDFTQKININGRGSLIKPSLQTLLEDVRTRGDRQHPFWAKVEL